MRKTINDQIDQIGKAVTSALMILVDIRRGACDLSTDIEKRRLERVLDNLEEASKSIYG